MNMNEAQQWIKQFYGGRGWTDYGPFIRIGFLMEEAGRPPGQYALMKSGETDRTRKYRPESG